MLEYLKPFQPTTFLEYQEKFRELGICHERYFWAPLKTNAWRPEDIMSAKFKFAGNKIVNIISSKSIKNNYKIEEDQNERYFIGCRDEITAIYEIYSKLSFYERENRQNWNKNGVGEFISIVENLRRIEKS